jgi:HNH endonuclease/AP2 domain
MTIEIPLTQGKVTIVDDIDADLAAFKWRAHKIEGIYYADRKGTILLHRVILARMLGRPLGRRDFVDHIDRDGLNNRRTNLRLASPAENTRNRGMQRNNTSGFRGVYPVPNSKTYKAVISIDGKVTYLGAFPTPEEAYVAYCEAARKYYGEFFKPD